MTHTARKFVYKEHFEGMPNDENFEIIEEDLPPITNGEFLAQAVYLSVDPYMRAYSINYELGSTLPGSQVAKIIESKNQDFPVGKYVVAYFGWRTLTISDGNPTPGVIQATPYLIPDDTVPLSLYLGILGMTGNTSYFGFLDVCKPKSGETVLVNAAAGAVGSHVGQIAKIKGCKVIGITSSDKKIRFLMSLGFDECINYKTQNLDASLKKLAPEGIDCFFDNVGGEMSSTILNHMRRFGRISVCGSIAAYNATEVPKAAIVQPAFVTKELEMQGFLVTRMEDRQMEGIKQNLQWYKEGDLKNRETVTEGFENMGKALIGVLSSENIGKAVVKV